MSCRRCSEPAAVQLPRGERLCSGCAVGRIRLLAAQRDEARAAHNEVATRLETCLGELREARAEVERLRRDLDACKAVLGFIASHAPDPEPGE
jgi:hypothetical protein